MSRNLFIVADGMNTRDRDTITNWLRTKKWGFSHWLEPIWLLSGLPDTYTARKLYDEITAILPSGEPNNTLIVCIDDPVTYWGKANPKMWEWMHAHWGKAG